MDSSARMILVANLLVTITLLAADSFFLHLELTRWLLLLGLTLAAVNGALWPAYRDAYRMRKIRFGQYVSPAVIAMIEADPKKYIREPRPVEVQFVLVQIVESAPANLNPLMESLVDAMFRHNATLDWITPTFLLATIGSIFPDASPEARYELAGELLRENGENVKVAYGQCIAHVGNIGSTKRLSWQAVIPGFTGILQSLLNAPFGTALEIPPSYFEVQQREMKAVDSALKGMQGMHHPDIEERLYQRFLRTGLRRSYYLETGEIAKANRAFDKLHAMKSELRSLPDKGKRVLERVLLSDNVHVQINAAATLLAVDERHALEALERIVTRDLGLPSFTAKMTIQEWKKGNLREYLK